MYILSIEIFQSFFQILAKGLPLVYIFDETRNILINNYVNVENILYAFYLNIIYLFVGISLFYFLFRFFVKKGSLINMGE